MRLLMTTASENRQNASAQMLLEVYEKRRRRNPSYSLRAFARDLGIAVSYLSAVSESQKCLSVSMARKIAERVRFGQAKSEQFIELVREDIARRKQKLAARKKVDLDFHQLQTAELNVIKDWEHAALFALLETNDVKHDVAWMAKRLSFPVETVKRCLENLSAVGLVKFHGSNMIPCYDNVTTTNSIPVSAIRDMQRSQIRHATDALDSVPVELRDISSMCLAFDPKHLSKVKALIRSFRRKFARLASKEKTEVYLLNVQFVPVTKVSSLHR